MVRFDHTHDRTAVELAAVYRPADPPRAGQLVLWSPAGAPLPDLGEPAAVALVPPPGDAIRDVPVRLLPVGDALPMLVAARSDPAAHGATRFWGAAALVGLQLVARGRLLPGVSPTGIDAWRVGPLDTADVERLNALAAAMPPEAHAVAVTGTSPPALTAAGPLLRAFIDAVADVLPRSPAAAAAAGGPAFAAPTVHRVPELRAWAEEIAAGVDAGVRLSLRVQAPADPTTGRFRAVVQVHPLADPTRVADLGAVWAGTAPGHGPRARADAVLAVRRAAGLWGPLEGLLAQAIPDELELDDAEINDLLADAAARLHVGGVEVHWPREVAPTLKSRVVAGRSGSAPTTFGAGADQFALDWEVALRGDPLTAAEMDELAHSHRPVVRLRGEWVLVDPTVRRRAGQRTAGPVTPITALGAALTGTVEIDGEPVPVTSTGWLEELRARITDPDVGDPDGPPSGLTAPPGLRGKLRDYQLRGLRWLAEMTSLGLGACLADDMGLGKTVTLIALHLHRRELAAGPTLLVCPASLLGNWEREIIRFAPGETVRRFHGSDRSLGRAAAGFVLTTYTMMRLNAPLLARQRWGMVVADEAQHVKNAASGTARALRTVPGGTRVALTGTPVENDLMELWAILDWTTPGLLGSAAAFRSRWAEPATSDPEVGARLARLVRPFLLRRRKSDPGIAPELPRKTETDHPVGLTREQAGLYAAAVAETMERIRGADGMTRRGLVMALLTALKQICNHPAQYVPEVHPVLAERSGKLDLLDELLDTILAGGGPLAGPRTDSGSSVLLFTQYVAMARLLERHLRDRGIPTQLLHGGTPVRVREEMVDRFQSGTVPVFLLSLRAAGTGLNLTRADHVVHYDRWWNPAVEDQATDRAYRIGQTRPVQVHRIIAEGTLEERIADLLAGKRALADAVLGGGEAALTELTDAELTELVTLRRCP